MPRKKKQAEEPATPQPSVGNGDGGVGTGRGAKTRAVELALRDGLSSPTEIAGYVRDRHGLQITPEHVSAVKASLRKQGRARGGRRKRAAATAASATQPAPAKRAAANGGLSARDLSDLARLAERAGGVDNLRQFLDVLKAVR
jgi:hypothetical protein